MSTASSSSPPSAPSNWKLSTDRRWACRLDYRRRFTSPLSRALEREVCRRDVVHWCNHWCVTLDPRERRALLPFDLFPRQEAFLRWLAGREEVQQDGLVEKSRDMGATWLCVAYAVHGWLFRSGYAVGFGSRKEMFVDELGNPDSIFEKARILLDNLPVWMLPGGYSRKSCAGYLKLVNPATGATITGEAGDNIGRGGRKSIYFVDEAAFIERPELVERSLSQNTRCRIDVSTPNGPGTQFYRKRFGGVVDVFVFDWRDDPRKNATETLAAGRVVYPWYEEQKRKFDPITVAQEIDRDHSASIEGICIPATWVRAAVDFVLPGEAAVGQAGAVGQASRLSAEPDRRDACPTGAGPLVAGFDIAAEGLDLSVIVPRRGPVVLWPRHWSGILPIQSAHKAIDAAEAIGIEELFYDTIGVGEGVRSAFQATERVVPFKPVPINVGDPPTDNVWKDGRKSSDKFVNLRAEAWWCLRERFRKVYEHAAGLAQYPAEEMIRLPNHPQLIAELSMPLIETTEVGKLRLESKEKMRARGIKSPDFADALALAYIPQKRKRELKIW